MQPQDLIADAAHRALDLAAPVLDGLSAEAAHTRTGGAGNSIAWLLWHAARQMDVQTVALRGGTTVWEAGGWARRLGVERDAQDFGLGDTAEDVSALRVTDVPALGEHLEACVDALVTWTSSLTTEDLGEVVDTYEGEPVTRGVRIVSMLDDAAVHVGQAAYARGLVDGWRFAV